MKKFINISLIAGILCLFFGTGLFFVGRAMGGGKVVKKLDFSSMLTTDSNNLEKDLNITGVYGRPIDGGAGILLDMPLNPDKDLKRITLETVSNDVVIGLMGITLQK